MPSDKTYASTMPREKKPYKYYTINMFRTAVIHQIARQWYGIDVTDQTKVRLIDEIMQAQEAEYQLGYLDY